MMSLEKFTVIAIDGGAASGKSSTAHGVAERLNLLHVDTGSHYRALTHFLLSKGMHAEPSPALDACLAGMRLDTAVAGRAAVLLLEGQSVSPAALRADAVNAHVSQFAGIQAVRQSLFAYQRGLLEVARAGDFAGLIMEGRDIGSVILPDADYRFFLFADSTTRSARRAAEGQRDSIGERDKLDSGRKIAPLLCPDGAMRIDTGEQSLASVVEFVCKTVTEAWQ